MPQQKTTGRAVVNGIFKTLIITLSVVSITPLLLILFHIFIEGISAIKPSFFTTLPKPVGEEGGGIANALVGSIFIVFFATLFSLPFGISVGVYLSEAKKSKFGDVVRICMEVLQGTPSIVIGIIAYIWVVRPMGHFSAISGSVALAIMMLPVVVRSTEETLSLIPQSLKEASLALGAPYYVTMIRIVIPAGLSGIITGVLLSVARIAGETAPLLFTAFGSQFMNYNMLKPMSSLPQVIYVYAISPYDTWHQLAWGASLVLIVLVLGLNIVSRVVARRWNRFQQ
jgi:phosphate transport system permease protein